MFELGFCTLHDNAAQTGTISRSMPPVDALPRLRELSTLRASLRERGAGPLHEQHLLRCWTQHRPLTRRGAAPDHFLPSRVLADWPGLADGLDRL